LAAATTATAVAASNGKKQLAKAKTRKQQPELCEPQVLHVSRFC